MILPYFGDKYSAHPICIPQMAILLRGVASSIDTGNSQM